MPHSLETWEHRPGQEVSATPADDRNGNGDIYWGRVLPDTSGLDGTGRVLCDDTNDQDQVSHDAGNGRVLVVWRDMRGAEADIYARIIVP